ncbi:MAG: CFI-box-CTERM domain-containing protein [Haloplanus sp.]
MSTDDGSDAEGTAQEHEDEDGADPSELGVGDGREKYVLVVTASGKEIEHGDVYLRHTKDEYIVSPDPDFPTDETTRYRKSNLHRVEITQHHSNCFITTATAGEGPTLDSLRGFRADVMSPTRTGRALLRVYETVSPPIAATLARHPDATSTRLVRRLVDRCGSLADRRDAARTRVNRAVLSTVLVVLYVVGVCLGALAHLWLCARETR